MTTKLHKLGYFIIVFTVFLSCNTKNEESINIENKSQNPLNPNGDSELAVLMRDMYHEAERIKTQIEKGEKVSVNLDHQSILTAHATEPEKASSPEYKAFAKSYLQSLESLQAANASQVASRFDDLVANCMACHQSLCPGPVVRIKKLQ